MKQILLAFWLLWCSGSAYAELSVPTFSAWAIDQTQTLSEPQLAELDATLKAFEQRKGSQIAVLIVASTAPESIEQYSLRVAEQWKLGRKGVDDGALVLIAKADRQIRIEVGYGLEGALPDAIAKRIVSETITPWFKKGGFYQGINAGITQMIGVVEGEALPPPVPQASYDAEADKEIGRFEWVLGLSVALSALVRLLGRFIFKGVAVIGGVGLAGVVAWLLFSSGFLVFCAAVATLIFSVSPLSSTSAGGQSFSGRSGGFGGSGGFGSGGPSAPRGGGGRFGGGGASGGW